MKTHYTKILLAAFSVLLTLGTQAQLYIPNGATLSLSGNALLFAGSSVINNGLIQVDNGTVVLQGDYTESGIHNAPAGTLVFSGSAAQQIQFGSGSVLNNVSIDKSSENVYFQSAIPQINGTLSLVSGLADIGNYDLRADNIFGGAAASFIQTSGNGALKSNVNNGIARPFPVGINSYSPVTISNNSGTGDVFSARVIEEVGVNGLTGPSISRNRVMKTWDISRTNSGPLNNVNFTFSWNPSDATALSVPALNHYQNGYWNQQNGTNSSSTNSLTYYNYSGSLSPFSIQEYYNSVINGKAFIQGFYTGSGAMTPALLNSGVSGATTAQADSITVEIHDTETGALAASPIKTILQTNGNFSATTPGLGGSYYLALKHRNALETWSASPMVMTESVNYDFSVSNAQAYGANMAIMGSGVYALWSGDLNQDGIIETSDYSQMENDIVSILFGYRVSDITGDGVVESSDYALLENNILNILFVAKPF